MSRHPEKPSSNGPITSESPLGSSVSGFDAARHRQELFGDYRDVDIEPPDPEQQERAAQGGRSEKGSVREETAAAIFEAYHATPRTLEEVGELHGRSDWTVSQIARRQGRYAEMEVLDELARELGVDT